MLELIFKSIETIPELWKYLSIPLVFALILGLWNWFIIVLTFYPTRFIGLFKLIGFHGSIHRRVNMVSDEFAERIDRDLISTQQLLEVLEPEILVSQIERVLRPHLDEYIDEIMVTEKGVVWENLPFFLKNRIYARCHRKLRQVIDNLIEEMGRDINHLFDLKDLVRTLFKNDPELPNLFFLESNRAVYRHLVQWAMLIALMMGFIPAILMFYVPEKWILPASGGFIGLAANMLVIKLIYGPIQLGPLVWAGALNQYVHQSNESFSELLSTRVLTISNIIDQIFRGPNRKRTRRLVQKHIHPIIEGTLIKTFSQFAMGARGFVELKNNATDKVIDISSYPFEDRDFQNDRARAIKRHIRKQLDSDNGELSHYSTKPILEQNENWLYIGSGICIGVTGLLLSRFLFPLL